MQILDNECFISKSALAVCDFASKDLWRPALLGIHIIDGFIEATDGWALASMPIAQGNNFPECIIKTADILRAGIYKFAKDMIGLKINYDSTHNLYIIHGEYDLITRPITEKFYNTNKMIYSKIKNETELTTIYLSHVLIKRLANIVGKSGYKSVALRILKENNDVKYPFREGQPIEFSAYADYSDGTLKGVIMPKTRGEVSINWISQSMNKDK